jgi:D-glycero-D-manno-heptose 1,7-bisphosphate phosphatase
LSGDAGRDRLVILDRDGTIVIDRGYLNDPAGLEFQPGAAEGLHWLHSHGYRLVVITNQSGIGRGLVTLDRLESMNARLSAMVEAAGARLERIYFCPHAPDAACTCRKPAPGLLLQAAAELQFDPRASVIIGDKSSDIELGRRAGAATVLISNDRGCSANAAASPDFIAADLLQAARWVTSRSASLAASK